MKKILILCLIAVSTGLGALSVKEEQPVSENYYEHVSKDKERRLDLLKSKIKTDIAELKLKNNIK